MFCQKIDRQAIFFIFSTNPRFPPVLLYVRCKTGVTFIRRSFRDEDKQWSETVTIGSLILLSKTKREITKYIN